MVRYADQPTVRVEIHVAAEPADIWALVSDINLPSEFSSEFVGADWLDGSNAPDIAVGARFRGRNAHEAIGEWQTECSVIAFEPERAFGWEVLGPEGPSAEWRFEIEPDASGTGCTVSQWARMGPGPSGLTPAIQRMPEKEEKIIARRLEEWRANMTANLEGIKALVEGRGAQT
jgi:hypothetical protein